MRAKSPWKTEARGVRARRRPACRTLVLLGTALGLLLALGAGNAFALSCSTTAAVTTVILNPGETVTMTVGAGDAITATGAGGSIDCGGTTSNVDLIAVFGSDVGVADPEEDDGVRDETLIIDNATGGRFEPGRTPDLVPGINEIEWLVNLGDDITPPLYERQRHARDQRHPGRRSGADRRVLFWSQHGLGRTSPPYRRHRLV